MKLKLKKMISLLLILSMSLQSIQVVSAFDIINPATDFVMAFDDIIEEDSIGPDGTFQNNDPFVTMYDIESLVAEVLILEEATIEREAEIETDMELGSDIEETAVDAATFGSFNITESYFDKPNVMRTRGFVKDQKIRQKRESRIQELNEEYMQDRYIVKYKSVNSMPVERMYKSRSVQTVHLRGHENDRLELITLLDKVNPKVFAEELKSAGFGKEIEYIQPDLTLYINSLNLDSESGADEENIASLPREEFNTDEESGKPDVENSIPVTVAIIDTGIDSSHYMLADYMVEGWNFPARNSKTYDPAQHLVSAHGTHIAGIIAQTVKEIGANIQIMPLQVFDNEVAYTSDILAAIDYAVSHGASIINCSFGSTLDNPALRDAIQNTEALFVCAAGNNRTDMAVTPSYPAAYRLPNLISVGSVNADGGFTYFSNYGSGFVDITALGRSVVSALPGGETSLMSGTSMATAYVTGGAVAVTARDSVSPTELRARLLDSADRLDNLQNKVGGGRKFNLDNALNGVDGQPLSLNPADDFDVHGLQPTTEEQWALFAKAGKAVQVAASDSHTLVLKENGTVWAWGYNALGHLGIGDTTTRYVSTPTQVIGLNENNAKVVAIAARSFNSGSMALKSDGTVWVWGYGQGFSLQDGVLVNIGGSTPLQVYGLNNIKAISANTSHYIALDRSGVAWAWGLNQYGQIGNGTLTNTSIPVRVSGINEEITAISAGTYFSLALANGKVYAWGRNNLGQLGNGTYTDSSKPIEVSSLYDVKSILSQIGGSYAIDSFNVLWAWGVAF